MLTSADIAGLIDHSLLKSDAAEADIERLCNEAIQYGFYSVCIQPFFVPRARALLLESEVRVTTVIGFPLGMNTTKAKVYEALEAALSGADEIDMVMNIGMAVSGRWDVLRKDIYDVIAATRELVHKVIIETCCLDNQGKIRASGLAVDAGAEFVKTSTGFCSAGATVGDIKLIKEAVKNTCGIKASGGIKTLSQVNEFIAAGATRIGTSAGTAIIREAQRLDAK